MTAKTFAIINQCLKYHTIDTYSSAIIG